MNSPEKQSQQQPAFSNPICKSTYNSLPKIYGSFKKKKATTPLIVPRSHPHNCLLSTEEVSKNKLRRKKLSKNNLIDLSLPRRNICHRKSCECHIRVGSVEETKTKRKIVFNNKRLSKLPPLLQNSLDDKESLHKVIKKRIISHSPLSGMSMLLNLQNVKSDQNNANNNADGFINQTSEMQSQINIKKVEKSQTEQIKIKRTQERFYENQIEKLDKGISVGFQELNKQLKQFDDGSEKQKVETKEFEVQVNLIEQMLEQRTQVLEQELSRTSKLSKVKAQRQKKKLMHHRKFYTQNNYTQEDEQIKEQKTQNYNEDEHSHSKLQERKREMNQNALNLNNVKKQQKKRQEYKDKMEKQANSSQSGKSSSILSYSRYIKNGLKNNTNFHELNKLAKERSLSGSKSSSSVGIFNIPKRQQYENYLKTYKPLDTKSFKMKNLVKKPLFTIIQENDGVYFGELKQEKKHGSGLHVTKKKIFEGEYEQNLQIKGSEKNVDGVYQGYFVNGKRQGYGTFVWNNGQKFEGNWKNGVKSGFGIWRSPKGDYYEGEWKHNRQEGQGVFRHKISSYKGGFVNFMKEGKGQQIFTNGDKYIGSYKEGKPHGLGKYIWADDSYYEGQFEQGMRNGMGKWVQEDGTVYEGQFKNDFKEGKGKQVYKDGSFYEGYFKQGQRYQGPLQDEVQISEQSENQIQQAQKEEKLKQQAKQKQLQLVQIPASQKKAQRTQRRHEIRNTQSFQNQQQSKQNVQKSIKGQFKQKQTSKKVSSLKQSEKVKKIKQKKQKQYVQISIQASVQKERAQSVKQQQEQISSSSRKQYAQISVQASILSQRAQQKVQQKKETDKQSNVSSEKKQQNRSDVVEENKMPSKQEEKGSGK